MQNYLQKKAFYRPLVGLFVTASTSDKLVLLNLSSPATLYYPRLSLINITYDITHWKPHNLCLLLKVHRDKFALW